MSIPSLDDPQMTTMLLAGAAAIGLFATIWTGLIAKWSLRASGAGEFGWWRSMATFSGAGLGAAIVTVVGHIILPKVNPWTIQLAALATTIVLIACFARCSLFRSGLAYLYSCVLGIASICLVGIVGVIALVMMGASTDLKTLEQLVQPSSDLFDADSLASLQADVEAKLRDSNVSFSGDGESTPWQTGTEALTSANVWFESESDDATSSDTFEAPQSQVQTNPFVK